MECTLKSGKNHPNKNKKSQNENVVKYVPCITGRTKILPSSDYDYDYAPQCESMSVGKKDDESKQEENNVSIKHTTTALLPLIVHK